MNTNYRIQRACVIGAGTMGAAIAAHLANVGIPVDLLDIVPGKLTAEEAAKGKTLADREVRDRLARTGLERARKARPAAFVNEDAVRLVRVGNTEDDFARVGEADWVIEAIIEQLGPKRALMERIEAARKPAALVSTNTSGIPIASIAEGRSPEFRAHFLGTHFFNPPRYLKLLEIIPTADTDPGVVAWMREFGERVLGKGVVMCKDTPNFIANRLASVSGAFMLDYVLEHGYTVEEVDRLTGELIGHPKTASFRLLDLVGFDVAVDVRRNLYDAVPGDESREVLRSPRVEKLSQTLLERGWLGNKSGQGFYKETRGPDGKKDFWPLNLETLEYEAPVKPRFPSVGKAKDVEPVSERVKILLAADDRAGQLIRALTWNSLAYASRRVPEIADDIVSVDNAVRWGFMHEAGPFQTWDALGVADTVARMEADGVAPAPWVKEMLAAGFPSFYQYQSGRAVGYYDLATHAYCPLPANPQVIVLKDLKATGKVIEKNPGATLVDLGDGVAGLEFHTKMNSLDPDIFAMFETAFERVDREFAGLVVGNDAANFCVGANIAIVAIGAQNQAWDQVELGVRSFQSLLQRMRYFGKPVVVAPAGMALGGGAEITMAGTQAVAAAESYIGLVEVGVGLVPAGGGCKEIVRRVVSPPMQTAGASALPYLRRAFETVGQAKVGTSAAESRDLGFLGPCDRIVPNRDHLLAEAKREVLAMSAAGYRPPAPARLYAAGRDALAALQVGIFMFRDGEYISDHDAKVGRKLAHVLCGGDLSAGQWVDEQHFLDLEREAFLSLVGEPKTIERIWHTLQTGKPLRN
jgi:3-hydroxyacyl-CoA dehydrogenase